MLLTTNQAVNIYPLKTAQLSLLLIFETITAIGVTVTCTAAHKNFPCTLAFKPES